MATGAAAAPSTFMVAVPTGGPVGVDALGVVAIEVIGGIRVSGVGSGGGILFVSDAAPLTATGSPSVLWEHPATVAAKTRPTIAVAAPADFVTVAA